MAHDDVDHSGIQLKPRIGITGSFGRGNYGDELYVKTYEYWFGAWANLYLLTGLPRAPYFREFGESYVELMDAVVLGGGDLICPYRPNIDRDFINPMYLQRPLHVAGIGVERNRPEIEPTVLKRWGEFLRHANIRSISTRDPDSKVWIDEQIKPSVDVQSHPDLVCALPLPKAVRPAGPPILGIVTRHIKHQKEYALLPEIAQKLLDRGWRVRHIIGGVGAHGAKDHENAEHVQFPGKETFYSEDLDDVSRALGECSLVLSMKLHTTIVAAMYGVPTVCVNPVVKARAFMRALERDDLVFSSTDRSLLHLVDNEVTAAPAVAVNRLRADASQYLRALGLRIWSDFRDRSSVRKIILPEEPVLLPAVASF